MESSVSPFLLSVCRLSPRSFSPEGNETRRVTMAAALAHTNVMDRLYA